MNSLNRETRQFTGVPLSDEPANKLTPPPAKRVINLDLPTIAFTECSVDELMLWCKQAAHMGCLLGEVVATLKINLEEGRALAKLNLGVEYDESHAPCWNMAEVLRALVDKIDKLEEEVEEVRGQYKE